MYRLRCSGLLLGTCWIRAPSTSSGIDVVIGDETWIIYG